MFPELMIVYTTALVVRSNERSSSRYHRLGRGRRKLSSHPLNEIQELQLFLQRYGALKL